VPGGSVWPAGAVKLTTGSALFRDSPIFSNTQYGDATLRSGYWKDVAAHGGRGMSCSTGRSPGHC
jgi:hypothetical protein